uniref:Uncharacterized protein n=1 Tax=Pyramimonas orientalis virus TaxID=455367 RepID=A0A7M3UNR0_POV01|nr:hypothetical protein HWQ62_00200 [Pyramimonas orientalis virus]
MSNFKDIIPLTKTKIVINAMVLVFMYIFLKPSTRNTIQNKNYHTHCSRIQIISEESEYTDLGNTKHTHDPIVMQQHAHSHDNSNKNVPRLNRVSNSNDNIYNAGYDRFLEYLLKAFVIMIVITSTAVFNATSIF